VKLDSVVLSIILAVFYVKQYIILSDTGYVNLPEPNCYLLGACGQFHVNCLICATKFFFSKCYCCAIWRIASVPLYYAFVECIKYLFLLIFTYCTILAFCMQKLNKQQVEMLYSILWNVFIQQQQLADPVCTNTIIFNTTCLFSCGNIAFVYNLSNVVLHLCKTYSLCWIHHSSSPLYSDCYLPHKFSLWLIHNVTVGNIILP